MNRVGALLLALCLLPALAVAQDLGDLGGSLDVSHVDAEVDGRDEETWRQLYTLNWSRSATDYIDLRAAFRYYKFDLESAVDFFGTFQEQVQPTAELAWQHPWFQFTATGSRRWSRSPAIAGQLINDSLLLNWQSAWMERPVLGVRYELNDVEETGSGAFRDVRNRRLTGYAEYERPQERFEYRITQSWTENVIRDTSSDELEQRLHYVGNHRLGERRQVQLSSQYRYSRVDRSNDVRSGARLLERVQPARGLGSIDATPDQDPLAEVPALIDGNTLAPVLPPLGIGAGDVDRNVGVDLGVIRDRVAAIYVYTDRLSASTVTWRVWVSDDNQNWDDSAVPAQIVGFNPALLRYEIEFGAIRARYVKVVNGGVNTVADVQVTEIEVFEARQDTDRIESDDSSHLADARLVWDVNRKWQLTTDGVVQLEPTSGSVGQRLDTSYGMRARYEPRFGMAHVARWAQSWRRLEGRDHDTRDDTAGYSFLYDPLPTLGSSLSASFRQSYEEGVLSLRNLSALAAASATPWRTVRASVELGAGRVDQDMFGLVTDSWNTRWTIDADITRQLRTMVTWLHQESFRDLDESVRVLRRFTFTGELQLSSAIFGRASLALADDITFSRRQEYLLSWRMFSALMLTGQAIVQDGSAGGNNERYSVNATLDLFDRFLIFRNVTVYARFSDVDQRESGASRILSWQQGLRATF